MTGTAMEFTEPASLAEAATFKAARRSRLLAGGTDLAVHYRDKLPEWDSLLYVGRLPELSGLTRGDDALLIGAAVTYGRLLAIGAPTPEERLLQQAARTIGSPGIMSMGTLGGNLGTASPVGDGSLVLLALDAEIEAVSTAGRRRIPASAFFTGYRETALKPDEIIASIHVPVLKGRARAGCFQKIGNRDASILSVVSSAVFLAVDDSGRCTRARIAVGAVAPTPLRTPEAEDCLVGHPLDTGRIADAAAAAADAATPIDDVRGSAWYRREMVPVVVRDALQAAARGVSKRKGART